MDVTEIKIIKHLKSLKKKNNAKKTALIDCIKYQK